MRFGMPWKKLDGNRAAEASIAGPVDPAHSARGDGGLALIRAEAGAGREGLEPRFAVDGVMKNEMQAFLAKSPEPPMPFMMAVPCTDATRSSMPSCRAKRTARLDREPAGW